MNLTKTQQKYLLISVATVSAIVIIVAVTVTIVAVSDVPSSEVQKLEFDKLDKVKYEEIPKLPLKMKMKVRQKYLDSRSNVKYAFVYSGQPRTWEQAIPTWKEKFEMYKPDVYLIINSKEMIHQERLENAFGKNVTIIVMFKMKLET
jgi:hypothetical protein